MTQASPEPYEFRTQPYAHQALILEKTWRSEHHGLLLEMGTGKSKICIDTICMLREREGLTRALILAPKGMYANWIRSEIPTHMPKRHLAETICHLWTGGDRRELERIELLMRPTLGLRIMVVNTEAISQSTSKILPILEKFIRGGTAMMVVDESSMIKNPDAKRTDKIIKLGRLARWRRICTGSPITRSPLDVYSQFEFLQSRCLGFSTFFTFRAQFAILEKEVTHRYDPVRKKVVEVPYTTVKGYKNLDRLSQILDQHATVLRKADCLDLPPKVYEIVHVDMTDEQERIYDDMVELSTAELPDGEFMTATQAIVRMLRCHQVLSGYVTSEDRVVKRIETGKTAALAEIVERIDGRLIVWCNYRGDVDRVTEQLTGLGYSCVRYYGGASDEERRQAVLRFQGSVKTPTGEEVTCPESERADVFVGTPASGGYGLTLTAASTVIYYSGTPNREHRMQSEDRAHRIGQRSTVTYIDMITPETVDVRFMEIQSGKADLSNKVFDRLALRDLLRPRRS